MNRAILREFGMPSVLCIAMILFALYLPTTCYGQEALDVEFSPNMINIDSGRVGQIRILTGMRYSFYAANKAEEPLFIYFNDGEESVQNIGASSDSLGNLILRFNLADLLDVEEDLFVDELNVAEVVVVTDDDTEYVGEAEILIVDRKGF